eukprot:TRINITY_DN67312_c7_g5_i2.p1 TRINITY_DN67312_c7_g5~~TRINITY_DN67312_c7_g5_i2.p1  ORF type:complete len:197 (+),score=9.79 TRINITY_DN67312_c7_g5_i2:27-617(+)
MQPKRPAFPVGLPTLPDTPHSTASRNTWSTEFKSVSSVTSTPVDQIVCRVEGVSKVCINRPEGQYIGSWKDQKPLGYGEMRYNSGNVYRGEWGPDGCKHGQGTFTYCNGDEYIGGWVADQMCGKGRYTCNGAGVYTGEFKADQMHGHGTYHFNSGDKFEGTWVNGQQDGKGIITTAKGEKYRALYKQGQCASVDPL